ncbi:unnamed protein product [Pylaiella littoralis]
MSARAWTSRLGLLAALLGYADVVYGFYSGRPCSLVRHGNSNEVATFNRLLAQPSGAHYRPRKVEAVAEDRGTSFETSRKQRGEDQFERWAAQVGIKAPKLRHEVFGDDLVGELRGLKAVEATPTSEQLVTVPAKAAISLTASESTPFRSWVSPEFWDSQQWYVKLALKLLWERQLGPASTVEGYVKVLPAQGSFETLIHWTDKELDALEYPKCAASAKRQRATWDKLHANLVEQCPQGAGRAISKDDLVWALECVLSRAFNGRFGGGQKSAIFSAGLLAASGAAYTFSEQPVWALLAALALLPLTLPELGSLNTALTGKPAKASDYVLVPFVDSMNHVTSAKTELSFSPVSGALGVSVNRGYREGEQAYISYGLKSNDELLQFYGFVEADCPADTYVVEDIATKLGELGTPATGSASIKDVVFQRGTEVVSRETLEGLRVLLGVEKGKEGGDGAVWRVLRTTCEAELSRVRPEEGAAPGGSVRERLASAFRREKASFAFVLYFSKYDTQLVFRELSIPRRIPSSSCIVAWLYRSVLEEVIRNLEKQEQAAA